MSEQVLAEPQAQIVAEDEEYTSERIISHLDECKDDWNFDEYSKPEKERVPLPMPTPEFLMQLSAVRRQLNFSIPLKEEKVRSLSPIDPPKRDKISLENFKIVDGGLAECPNCTRTFFPDRLAVHLNSCKPGKPLKPTKRKLNMRWKSPKQKEISKTQLRMPLLGKDMMITGKIIEKAEEEEEDSDNFSRNEDKEEYEDDFDFEQYKNLEDDCIEIKKINQSSHLTSALKDRGLKKRERCEFCNCLFPSNRIGKHKEECNIPQSQKLILNVKSIKFAERVQKKKGVKFHNNDYSDSGEDTHHIHEISKTAERSMPARQKEFKIKMKSGKSGSSFSIKNKSILKNVRRENEVEKSMDIIKRPSTKDNADRNNNISRISEGMESASCQFNTSYPIQTPIKHTSHVNEIDVNQVYGLSKTNESFQKLRQDSNGKAQNSTIGFSSSTNNTTGYSKSFGDSAFRNSKYMGCADQTTLTRSSFYKDRDLSETLMMRSQTYHKIECPHCCRRFCRKAAERHIPLCEKIFNKPKPLFRNKEKQFLPKLNESSVQNMKQPEDKIQNLNRKPRIAQEEAMHIKHKSLKTSHNHSSASSRSLLDKVQNPDDIKNNERDRSNTINVRSGYTRNSFVNNKDNFINQAKVLANKLCNCCGKKYKPRDRFCVNCGNKR